MSIKVVQFDGSTVSPKDDATMYDILLGDYGKYYGLNVSYLGSNQIRVGDGRLIIKGRVVIIEEETVNVELSQSGSQKGRLYLQLDLSKTENPCVFLSEVASELSELTQEENVNYSNGIYEVEICNYDVDETTITNLVTTMPTIDSGGIATYTHTYDADTGVHTLEGSGANGKFKSAYTGTVSGFVIGETTYSVKQGEETTIDLVEGVWYPIILDSEDDTVNFSSGGASLPIKVVGSATEPNNPKENNVWVNTDIVLNRVYFGRTNGLISNPLVGDCWIVTGYATYKTNALKVDSSTSLIIEPIGAYVYDGSSWVSVNTYIYKSGTWHTCSPKIASLNGRVSKGQIDIGASASGSVTFSTPFDSTPVIYGEMRTRYWYRLVTISDSSRTGFKYTIKNNFGTNGYDSVLNWYAELR